ncbi:MAG: PIG-L family deacetylase [Anaerolineales bacterium]|nr:PIG-L family deacetylase [Anaerolineales bacterium]MCB0004842.1 PIG-L family deacetylase [Anaerolineales bacterium]MCB0011793.1 PIG-L family deacetylase [Anaerolineales bacterium]
MSNEYIPERAMFIYAHPDDIEFGCAGTAAKWAKYGSIVTYVVITDGNIGTDDLEMKPEVLAATRRAEQQAAADIAGVTNMIFLGYPDGMLVPDLTLRKDLTRLIREHKPNVVVCGDPTVVLHETRINHPDHRAAATAAVDAVFPSADSPLLFPDLLEAGYMPHKVNYVYITNWSEATLFIDISETIDTKIKALKEHKCQLGDWDPEERMKSWAQEIGKKVGFAYAEAFRKITLREIHPEQSETA